MKLNDFMKNKSSIETLKNVMALLRDPKKGCPWDKEQSFESIADCTIEEAYEVVEAIDPQPVEGIRATGATPLEEIIYGVLPQVFPLWISYSLYRFEANVRSASVIGMVGAGGIGMLLWDAIRGFDYGKTAAIILTIIVVVSFLDFASAHIRRFYI